MPMFSTVQTTCYEGSGIPSGCFVLSRSSIRGAPLRFDPRLPSVTPSASGMPQVAFAVSPPQRRIRRPVIAIFRSPLGQDGWDCSKGIYDREAIKESSRGLQRSGNPRNRSTSQKRILKGCQKRFGLNGQQGPTGWSFKSWDSAIPIDAISLV